MEQELLTDVAISHMMLGSYISRRVKEGAGEDELMPLKRSWLRLNWFFVKTSTCPKSEFRARAALLREGAKKGLSVSPDFVPCHSAQSLLHFQPCNRLSEKCRCAQQLQCELPKVFSNESPNVVLRGAP